MIIVILIAVVKKGDITLIQHIEYRGDFVVQTKSSKKKNRSLVIVAI